MLLRMTCTHCRTPYSLNPEQVSAALDEIHENDFKHFNSPCPNCGKTVKIPKKSLRRAAPQWAPPKPKKAEKKSKETKE